ncbi:MAG: hypothetical protein IT422_06740 [Pirellulaceae bacterium]|jgi:hypothetical protein|nr:hypothetical protein [Pirellulaceae bacterium]
MQVHDRDIAEFFLIALKSSDWRQQFVQLETIIAWVDEVILRTDIPPGWMLDLSIAKTEYDVAKLLGQVPTPKTEYLGASIFVAYVGRLFRDSIFGSELAAWLLRNLGDDVDPQLRVLVERPWEALDDYDLNYNLCCSNPSKTSAAELEARSQIDSTLKLCLEHFRQYERLIPSIVTDS